MVLYAAGIFYLSSQPSPDIPPPFPYFDKLVHFGLYTGFAFFVARAMAVQRGGVDRFTIWIAIVIASLYGASDEAHQYLVPTRSCDVWDWVMDLLGSVMGAMAYVTFNYWALKRFVK